MSELKPCPFCGNEATIRHHEDGDYMSPFEWSIECSFCANPYGVPGHNDLSTDYVVADLSFYSDHREEVIRAWNARAEATCRRVVHGADRDRLASTVSYTCSSCGKHIGRDDAYCKNCGAKVVG